MFVMALKEQYKNGHLLMEVGEGLSGIDPIGLEEYRDLSEKSLEETKNIYLEPFMNCDSLLIDDFEQSEKNHSNRPCPTIECLLNPNSIEITSTKKEINFRSKSEVIKYLGERDQKTIVSREGHGGISMLLKLRLPRNFRMNSYLLIISTIPSEDAVRRGYHVHPTLLHMNLIKERRIFCSTEIRYPLDWKLVFHIIDGNIFYEHNYRCKYITENTKTPCTEKLHKIGTLKEVSEDDSTSTLEFRTPAITIILPKLNEFDEVIEAKKTGEEWNHCKSCKLSKNADNGSYISKFFKGKKEQELSKLRLKAVLQKKEKECDRETANNLAVATSTEIINSKLLNHLPFDLEETRIDVIRYLQTSDVNKCCKKAQSKLVDISKHFRVCTTCISQGSKSPPTTCKRSRETDIVADIEERIKIGAHDNPKYVDDYTNNNSDDDTSVHSSDDSSDSGTYCTPNDGFQSSEDHLSNYNLDELVHIPDRLRATQNSSVNCTRIGYTLGDQEKKDINMDISNSSRGFISVLKIADGISTFKKDHDNLVSFKGTAQEPMDKQGEEVKAESNNTSKEKLDILQASPEKESMSYAIMYNVFGGLKSAQFSVLILALAILLAWKVLNFQL